MNKFAKMAALLMSAAMCAFTSCGDGSGDKHEDDIASPKVAQLALMTYPDVLNCVEGTVTVQFQPSGKSKTININEATGRIDQEMFGVAQTYSGGLNLSAYEAKGGCVTFDLTGSINDTAMVITPDLKAKDGLDFSADKTYDCKLMVPYRITINKGFRAGVRVINGGGVHGDKFQKYCKDQSKPYTVKLN